MIEPVNSVAEGLYVAFYVIVLNVLLVWVLFLDRNVLKIPLQNIKYVGAASFFLIVGAIVFYWETNSYIDDKIDTLAGKVNNLQFRLKDCVNVHDPLQEYHIQHVVRTSLRDIRVGALVMVLISTLIICGCVYFYLKNQSMNLLWISFSQVMTLTYVGAVLIFSIDAIYEVQDFLGTTDGVARKIAQNCTDTSWGELLVLELGTKCTQDIETYMCSVRDTIDDIKNYDLGVYIAATWMISGLPPICCALLLFFSKSPSEYKKVSSSISMEDVSSLY